MAKEIRVTFRVTGLIRPDEQTGCFVSFCPALGLYSAGRTRPDARTALQGAVDLFVQICYSRGILVRELKARGFEMVQDSVEGVATDTDFIQVSEHDAQHSSAYDDEFHLDVPMELVASSVAAGQAACLQ